ncbi:hypothetical protein PanWU01x14_337870 [Parasponia andersonii]|uniref:Uncharacterized protein n=1 Tax=Parasponia andersonii TaxID=3476 RepID=A0A2P5AFF2_PARAD|nr:hypothetical protein PanWU01x14_337870 [Parasponia andersonii]
MELPSSPFPSSRTSHTPISYSLLFGTRSTLIEFKDASIFCPEKTRLTNFNIFMANTMLLSYCMPCNSFCRDYCSNSRCWCFSSSCSNYNSSACSNYCSSACSGNRSGTYSIFSIFVILNSQFFFPID